MPSRTKSRRRQPTTSNQNQTTSNANKESNKKMALTQDQIAELLKDNRGRGDYGQYLKQFVESGSAGEEVDTTSGLLAGKDAAKVKTGLENAKKARDKDGILKFPEAQNVLVVKKTIEGEDHVFVINRDVAGGTEE